MTPTIAMLIALMLPEARPVAVETPTVRILSAPLPSPVRPEVRAA